jgi:hypothetical protein
VNRCLQPIRVLLSKARRREKFGKGRRRRLEQELGDDFLVTWKVFETITQEQAQPMLAGFGQEMEQMFELTPTQYRAVRSQENQTR